MNRPGPEAIEIVRARFPSTPDADAAELRSHAALLTGLRGRLDHGRLRGAEPAMHFDPRGETT